MYKIELNLNDDQLNTLWNYYTGYLIGYQITLERKIPTSDETVHVVELAVVIIRTLQSLMTSLIGQDEINRRESLIWEMAQSHLDPQKVALLRMQYKSMYNSDEFTNNN